MEEKGGGSDPQTKIYHYTTAFDGKRLLDKEGGGGRHLSRSAAPLHDVVCIALFSLECDEILAPVGMRRRGGGMV